ncbi:MAG: hypothetical protein LBL79_02290, partial [Prevotella sp.]|nr:hypothetical protein [Prevotella sp.]
EFLSGFIHKKQDNPGNKLSQGIYQWGDSFIYISIGVKHRQFQSPYDSKHSKYTNEQRKYSLDTHNFLYQQEKPLTQHQFCKRLFIKF